MQAHEYSDLAYRMAGGHSPIIHACFGMAGETGEVVDIVKKSVFYGKELDRTKVLEEIGDNLWYVNLLIRELGSTWEEVFEMNIKKLSARYPDLKFDADRAINRDTAAEQEAMGQ